jgi:hypothetical protein
MKQKTTILIKKFHFITSVVKDLTVTILTANFRALLEPLEWMEERKQKCWFIFLIQLLSFQKNEEANLKMK